jgi:hypothetical protein
VAQFRHYWQSFTVIDLAHTINSFPQGEKRVQYSADTYALRIFALNGIELKLSSCSELPSQNLLLSSRCFLILPFIASAYHWPPPPIIGFIEPMHNDHSCFYSEINLFYNFNYYNYLELKYYTVFILKYLNSNGFNIKMFKTLNIIGDAVSGKLRRRQITVGPARTR